MKLCKPVNAKVQIDGASTTLFRCSRSDLQLVQSWSTLGISRELPIFPPACLCNLGKGSGNIAKGNSGLSRFE